MRQTIIYTVDRRLYYVAESLDDIGDMYIKSNEYYMILTETNNSGSNQSSIVFLIKHVVCMKDIR